MAEMTHLDLCSGIGGFKVAAQVAGFETVGFAEVDPFCCALLTEKWPEIPNYGDLRRADFIGLRGRVDVLSAGVPCQPASLAGKRRGATDDRWLWPAVLDVVGELEPAWAIFENPVGILSLDEFAGIYLRLESLGYEVAPPFSVSANAVGAKHRRQRIFIVANAKERRIRCGSTQQSAKQTRQFTCSGQAVADADRARLEKLQSGQPRQCASIIGSGGFNGNGQFECGIRRVADGFSDWLDGAGMPFPLTKERQQDRAQRLRGLGNAVVPQQAYPFFAAIAQIQSGFAGCCSIHLPS